MLVRNHARDLLSLGWVVQRHPARNDGPPVTGLACSFIVKGTFRLVAHAPAEPVADGPEPLAGDTPWPDEPDLGLAYPSDFPPWKPCGEWLAVGTARPPLSYPLDAAHNLSAWKGAGDRGRFTIRVAVGDAQKSLEVVAPEARKAGLALPFGRRPPEAEAVPVSFALAYGGPDHPTNPIGRESPILRLPGRPAAADDDPAGFGPVPADWPQRVDTRGTYDDEWLATMWPWLPADIDYRHFLAAAPDQWVAGYFQGDEPVAVTFMHPSQPQFTGFLPGIRPRLSVVRRPPVGDGAARPRGFDASRPLAAGEVPLALDTVWLDVDREKLVLVWRGLVAIATPKLPDIALVTLAAERCGEPAAAIESFIEPNDVGRAPEPLAAEQSPAEESPSPDTDPAARAEALAAAIDGATSRVKALREKLEADGTFARIRAAMADAPSREEMLARAEKLAAGAEPGSPAATSYAIQKQVRAVEAAAEELAAAVEAQIKARRKAREAEASARILPRFPDGRVDVAEAARRCWRTMHLSGEDLAGLDLAGADLAATDLSGASLAGANLQGANLAGARLARANLTAADLAGASLAGADLSAADLSRALLASADLSHADFSAATVAAVAWRGSTLTAAKLTGLDLAGADLSGCTADHADFAKANLAGASFADCRLAVANFTGANLERATFSKAVLQWAAFGGAAAREASFVECDLAKFRGEDGADFRGARFTRCRGPEAVFEAARLDGATISRCDLERARFAEAALTGATIDRCNLRHAVFEDAGLAGAKLTKSNLFEAVFDRADLTGASLAESNAYGSGFWESTLDDLDIAGAIVAGTVLN
ncbi:MAG: DUF2169 domain-containing protein [Planctomycetia bacterium]|nr:DUF2169 domain-containing protein [Planctomycetia bacterium]